MDGISFKSNLPINLRNIKTVLPHPFQCTTFWDTGSQHCGRIWFQKGKITILVFITRFVSNNAKHNSSEGKKNSETKTFAIWLRHALVCRSGQIRTSQVGTFFFWHQWRALAMAQSRILNICPSIVVLTMKIYIWTIITNKLISGHGATPAPDSRIDVDHSPEFVHVHIVATNLPMFAWKCVPT